MDQLPIRVQGVHHHPSLKIFMAESWLLTGTSPTSQTSPPSMPCTDVATPANVYTDLRGLWGVKSSHKRLYSSWKYLHGYFPDSLHTNAHTRTRTRMHRGTAPGPGLSHASPLGLHNCFWPCFSNKPSPSLWPDFSTSFMRNCFPLGSSPWPIFCSVHLTSIVACAPPSVHWHIIIINLCTCLLC